MIEKKQLSTHLQVILCKMCEVIKVDVNDIDFYADEWQETQKWTIREEINFQEWLYNYLVQNKDAIANISEFKFGDSLSDKEISNLTKEFTLFYGWALKEESEFLLSQIKENTRN